MLSSLIIVVLAVSVFFSVCASVDMLGVKVAVVVCDLLGLGACTSALYSSRPLERLSFIWSRNVLSVFCVRVIEVVSVETRCWFARVV